MLFRSLGEKVERVVFKTGAISPTFTLLNRDDDPQGKWNELYALLNILPSLILVVDRKATIHFTNHPAPGMPSIGSSYTAGLSQTAADLFRDKLHGALVSGQTICFDYELSNDQWHSCYLIPNIHGSADRIVAVISDISAAKRSERELAASEERFRQLAENIEEVLWLKDLNEDRVIYVTPSFSRIWGQSYDHVKELPGGFDGTIHPEDRARVISSYDGQASGEYDEEYRIIRPSGEIRWVRDRTFPICRDNGAPWRVAGIAEDITDYKCVKEELQKRLTAIESSLDGIAILGPDEKFVYVNQAHALIYGYQAHELLGKTWRVLYSTEQLSRFEQLIMPSFRRTGRWRGEAVGLRKDGSTFDQEVSLTILPDGGLVCVVRDITDRKRMDRERERLAAEAAVAARLASLGELAAGVAHEINNPLNGIINYAELLLENAQEGKNSQYLKEIISEGQRISNIVSNLLSFAREPVRSYSELSPALPLHAAMQLMEAQLTKDGIIIKTDLSTTPAVFGNAQQLQQVFMNILSNARYALNTRFPGFDPRKVLEISLAHGNHTVIVTFRDHGSGIARDQIDKIFDPFFTTKPPGKGTGLGLSISYGIMEQHKGKIAFDSKEGEYTEAVVTLPARSP